MSDQTSNVDHYAHIWHGEQVWRWWCFYNWPLFWYSPELQQYIQKVDEKWVKTMPIRQIWMKIKRVSGEVEKVDSLVAPKELRWIIKDSLQSTPFLMKLVKSKAWRLMNVAPDNPAILKLLNIDFNTPFSVLPPSSILRNWSFKPPLFISLRLAAWINIWTCSSYTFQHV